MKPFVVQFVIILYSFTTFAQNKNMNTTPKMKVEIWSDIMCPFCYIGKRNLEAALKQFPDTAMLEIEWKSFQLDPSIPAKTDKNVYQYLAERKGWSMEQTMKIHQNVVQMAKDAGLTYNFDSAVVANSFDAHRLIQLAKEKGLGDNAEERLFSAYFTEGKNFGNHDTLLELGKEIGLKEEDIKKALADDVYAYKVKQDIAEAQHIGVTGVPFFVFDRKYAISGAQPVELFMQTLQQSVQDWKKNNPHSMDVKQGAVCTPEGDCK